MILIAHRGNIDGKFEIYENNPDYIDLAIQNGFDVEIDIWYVAGVLYLGHDKPQYVVKFTWLLNRISKLWIHCKNIDSVLYFQECTYKFNYFWHQKDTIVLTSFNHIWAYPGNQPIKNSIAVMPEINDEIVTNCKGICSDYIKKYKNKI